MIELEKNVINYLYIIKMNLKLKKKLIKCLIQYTLILIIIQNINQKRTYSERKKYTV